MSGEKPVQQSQIDYVKSVLSDLGDNLVRLVRVVKHNKKRAGKTEDRLLALSEFRILTFKHGVSGKKLCQSGHLYELDRVVYTTEYQVEFHFKEWFIKFETRKAPMIMKIVLESLNRVCCSWPDVAKPRVEANSILLRELEVLEFDASRDHGAVTFVETYRALCAVHSVAPSPDFIDHVKNAFKVGRTTLVARWHGSEISTGHMQALVSTLMHDTFFTSVDLDPGSTNIDGERVGSVLTRTMSGMTTASKVSFANLNMPGAAAEGVIRGLSDNRKITLRHIDFTNNRLGDHGVATLGSALSGQHSLVEEIIINNVGMTNKGLRRFLESLSSDDALLRHLLHLDISHNTIGKAGTSMLVQWFRVGAGSRLRKLNVASTGVALPELLSEIELQGHVELTFLSIANTRIEGRAAAALAKFAATSEVSMLDVSRCIGSKEASLARDREALENVIAALAFNRGIRNSTILSSGNNMGVNMGRRVASIASVSHSLVKLDLSHCQLGDEGVALVCQGFAQNPASSINWLNLSCNSRHGDDKAACKWLPRLVESCPTLQTLIVCGGVDPSSRGGRKLMWSVDVKPLFVSLHNNRSLTHLDVSSNAVNDEAIAALCQSLRSNKSLKTMIWNNNRTTFQSLRAFAHVLYVNDSLISIGNPTVSVQEAGMKRTRDQMREINDKLAKNAQMSAGSRQTPTRGRSPAGERKGRS